MTPFSVIGGCLLLLFAFKRISRSISIQRQQAKKNADDRQREIRQLEQSFLDLLKHIWIASEFAGSYPHPSSPAVARTERFSEGTGLRGRALDILNDTRTRDLYFVLSSVTSTSKPTSPLTRSLVEATWDMTNELAKFTHDGQPFRIPDGDWLALYDLPARINSGFIMLQPCEQNLREISMRADIWLDMLPRIFSSLIHDGSDLMCAHAQIASLRLKVEGAFFDAVTARVIQYDDRGSWHTGRRLINKIRWGENVPTEMVAAYDSLDYWKRPAGLLTVTEDVTTSA
jgi:hypothetical protein